MDDRGLTSRQYEPPLPSRRTHQYRDDSHEEQRDPRVQIEIRNPLAGARVVAGSGLALGAKVEIECLATAG